MSDAKAKIEIEASASRLPAALRAALGKIQDFGESVGRVGAGVVKSTALGFVHGIGMAVANRGLDLMIEQGKQVLDFQRELVRFGIAVRKSPAEMEEMGKAARQVSSEIGLDALEVLKAGKAYVDLAGAQAFSIDSMRILARAAQASGAATTDLAGMMFQLHTSMKIPDNEMEDAIGGLINQAKDGAIEAKQMATEFGAILPLFARFGVVGREGTAQAGAFFQIMRNGANTAAEAGTMMQRVYAGIQSYAPRFEAQGIQVYEKKRDPMGRKVYRPFMDLFKDIIKSDAMKDPHLVKAMFGRTEGWRGILLLDEAKRAMGETGDTVDQFVSKLDALIRAGRENGVVQHDLATQTESAGGRIDIAVQRIKNGFAEALTPDRVEQIVGGIEQIANAMPAIVGAISDVMDAFSGMVLAFRKTKDWASGFGGYKYNAVELQAVTRGMPGYQNIQAKAAAYEDAMRDTLGMESATGPTPASIEAAVRDSMVISRGPGQEGVRAAGQAYLRERGVSPYAIEQIRKKVADEISRNSGFDPEAVKNAVRDGVMSAMRNPALAGPVVNIDGNKANSALGDASGARRR